MLLPCKIMWICWEIPEQRLLTRLLVLWGPRQHQHSSEPLLGSSAVPCLWHHSCFAAFVVSAFVRTDMLSYSGVKWEYSIWNTYTHLFFDTFILLVRQRIVQSVRYRCEHLCQGCTCESTLLLQLRYLTGNKHLKIFNSGLNSVIYLQNNANITFIIFYNFFFCISSLIWCNATQHDKRH